MCEVIPATATLTGNLLVHLIDISQDHAVEFAIIGHLEQAAVGALGHLNDGLLDIVKFGDDGGVVARLVIDTFQYFERLLFLALHDEPSRAFREIHDHAEDDETEEDLEGERESPSDLMLTDPGTGNC